MPGLFFSFLLFVFLDLAFSEKCDADPLLAYWIVEGKTGFAGEDADCDWIKYDDDYVYASCTGIPSGYSIGPWSNPNIPADNDYIYRFPLKQEEETGEKERLPLGPAAAMLNGVAIFSASSVENYNENQIWWENAILTEVDTMDDCMGHPAGTDYHHHSFPVCMYSDDDGTKHSPIYGFSYDGYPIYGPYGYSDPEDSSSEVIRMKTGYSLRDITDRTTLPDGTTLPSEDQGPEISDEYPLGLYLQDFEWLETNGDLDRHNGRFSVTPEYPEGTYVYYFTIDNNGDPEFPFTIYETYYGVIHGSSFENIASEVPDDAIEFNVNTCEASGMLARVLVVGMALMVLLLVQQA